MSYICAYCDDEFSDNVMCPECVEHDSVTQRGLREDLERACSTACGWAWDFAASLDFTERYGRAIIWAQKEDMRTRAEKAETKLQQAMEALELAEEALTQAYVDEANCDGLHVAKGHHTARAKNDCFELWASVPAHQEALNKVRAILEPERTKA